MRKSLKFIIGFCLMFCLINISQVEAKNFKPVPQNPDQYVTMYAKEKTDIKSFPQTSSKTIGTLSVNEQVTVISIGDTWNEILFSNKKGFVQKTYLSKVKIKAPSTALKNAAEEKQAEIQRREEEERQREAEKNKAIYSASYFKSAGVIYWGGWRWTWYSQRVLPGRGLRIPGRHVNANGYVVDANERICLASSKLSKGTIVSTPFGAEGCVYDSGCPSNTLDVYTNF